MRDAQSGAAARWAWLPPPPAQHPNAGPRAAFACLLEYVQAHAAEAAVVLIADINTHFADDDQLEALATGYPQYFRQAADIDDFQCKVVCLNARYSVQRALQNGTAVPLVIDGEKLTLHVMGGRTLC